MKSISAVAFDIDGTLYPNSSMYWRSVPFVLSNISLLLAFNKVRKLIRRYEFIQDFPALQTKMLAAELKISESKTRAILEKRIFSGWFKVFKTLKPFPHLKELLDELKERKLPMVVMSDFPIRGRLDDLGLGDYWNHSFSSEDTGYLKPHPKPFHRISELLDIAPEKILYVGNSFGYDILGAKSVGMMAAHVSKKRPKHSPAELTFWDYRVLQDFILNRL